MTASRRALRPSWNFVELLMIAVGCLVVAYGLGRNTAPRFVSRAEGNELQQLAGTYGPERNSEHAEEWIVRDFFGDKRGGTFIDVGANHYKNFSNTYYLETALGWSGVAIEPQTKFEAEYHQYRPKTRFLPLFVSDRTGGRTVLNVPSNDLVASANRQFADSFGSTAKEVEVGTATLDDIVTQAQVTTIDFLSMDIELAEPAALRGFSIGRVRPALVCVEAHPEVRQQILDYFASHGYTVAGKYLRADTDNIWFMPLDR